jgi:hypothetical protein
MTTRTAVRAVRRVVDPVKEFLHAEATGGLVLLAAAMVGSGGPTAHWARPTRRCGVGS